MSLPQMNAETLNAYVDGELSSSEAAEVARAAARDPAVAARIATLRELKAAVTDIAPERELIIPRSASRAWGLGHAIAACLIFLASGIALHLATLPASPARHWAATLNAHHHAWTFSSDRQAVIQPADAPSAILPLDLSSSRLAYVGQERIAVVGRKALRLGYEGTRGCHLSLFVLPQELGLSANVFAPPMHVRLWREGDNLFLLMADGMAVTRFRQLAAAIERALREQRPFDAQTRQQLAQSRAASRPCQA